MAKQGKKYTTDELDFLKEKVCETWEMQR